MRLLALLLLLLAASASAQTGGSPAAPAAKDPRAVAVARTLLEMSGVERQLDSVFVQLAPMFAQSVIGALAQDTTARAIVDAANAKEDGAARMTAILSQEFLSGIKQRYPELIETMAGEYAATFTLGELEAIVAFYRTPAGAKALKLIPELQARMGAAGQEIGRGVGSEAAQRSMERISREILEIKDRPQT